MSSSSRDIEAVVDYKAAKPTTRNHRRVSIIIVVASAVVSVVMVGVLSFALRPANKCDSNDSSTAAITGTTKTTPMRDVAFSSDHYLAGLYELIFHVPSPSPSPGGALDEIIMRVDFTQRHADGSLTIRAASGPRVILSANGSSAFFHGAAGDTCSLEGCEIVDLLPGVETRSHSRRLWWSVAEVAVAIWRSVAPPPLPPPPFAYFRDSEECLLATAAAEQDSEYMALYLDSANVAREFAETNGWSYDGEAPSGSHLDDSLRYLQSIYSDGASALCSSYEGSEADICALIGVWQMQLGSRDQILSVLRQRAVEWTSEKLTDVRRKDALWSWTYSRFFYQDTLSWLLGRYGYENRLYLSDNRETAMMELIVQSLQKDPGDTSVLDKFHDAYVCANREKYELMLINSAGLANAVRSLSGIPHWVPQLPQLLLGR